MSLDERELRKIAAWTAQFERQEKSQVRRQQRQHTQQKKLTETQKRVYRLSEIRLKLFEDLKKIPAAPIFYPTVEEFKEGPSRYLEKIYEKIVPYGIATIVPPKEWKAAHYYYEPMGRKEALKNRRRGRPMKSEDREEEQQNEDGKSRLKEEEMQDSTKEEEENEENSDDDAENGEDGDSDDSDEDNDDDDVMHLPVKLQMIDRQIPAMDDASFESQSLSCQVNTKLQPNRDTFSRYERRTYQLSGTLKTQQAKANMHKFLKTEKTTNTEEKEEEKLTEYEKSEREFWDWLCFDQNQRNFKPNTLYATDVDTKPVHRFPNIHNSSNTHTTENLSTLLSSSSSSTFSSAVSDTPSSDQCFGWDLSRVATSHSSSSVLQYLPEALPGVTDPMLYVGMRYSSFAWHYEDHFLFSMAFNHPASQPKTWYGVPGAYWSQVENYAAEKLYPKLSKLISEETTHEKKSLTQSRFLPVGFSPLTLLSLKSSLFSPTLLRNEADIPVYRALHPQNSFIVTLPGAFHSGFSHGFSISEAVNFALTPWLVNGHATLAEEIYRSRLKVPVISHDQLLIKMAYKILKDWVECKELLQVGQQISQTENSSVRINFRNFLSADSPMHSTQLIQSVSALFSKMVERELTARESMRKAHINLPEKSLLVDRRRKHHGVADVEEDWTGLLLETENSGSGAQRISRQKALATPTTIEVDYPSMIRYCDLCRQGAYLSFVECECDLEVEESERMEEEATNKKSGKSSSSARSMSGRPSFGMMGTMGRSCSSISSSGSAADFSPACRRNCLYSRSWCFHHPHALCSCSDRRIVVRFSDRELTEIDHQMKQVAQWMNTQEEQAMTAEEDQRTNKPAAVNAEEAKSRISFDVQVLMKDYHGPEQEPQRQAAVHADSSHLSLMMDNEQPAAAPMSECDNQSSNAPQSSSILKLDTQQCSSASEMAENEVPATSIRSCLQQSLEEKVSEESEMKPIDSLGLEEPVAEASVCVMQVQAVEDNDEALCSAAVVATPAHLDMDCDSASPINLKKRSHQQLECGVHTDNGAELQQSAAPFSETASMSDSLSLPSPSCSSPSAEEHPAKQMRLSVDDDAEDSKSIADDNDMMLEESESSSNASSPATLPLSPFQHTQQNGAQHSPASHTQCATARPRLPRPSSSPTPTSTLTMTDESSLGGSGSTKQRLASARPRRGSASAAVSSSSLPRNERVVSDELDVFLESLKSMPEQRRKLFLNAVNQFIRVDTASQPNQHTQARVSSPCSSLSRLPAPLPSPGLQLMRTTSDCGGSQDSNTRAAPMQMQPLRTNHEQPSHSYPARNSPHSSLGQLSVLRKHGNVFDSVPSEQTHAQRVQLYLLSSSAAHSSTTSPGCPPETDPQTLSSSLSSSLSQSSTPTTDAPLPSYALLQLNQLSSSNSSLITFTNSMSTAANALATSAFQAPTLQTSHRFPSQAAGALVESVLSAHSL
jgi:hypothetical protein